MEVIAEFGQSCRGDLGTAMMQAGVAKDAGCTWSKWQMFATERLVSPDAKRYWDASLGGSESQFRTFTDNRMLQQDEWSELKKYCDDIGIKFLVTPFDLEAVDILESIGVECYKVASGDINFMQLLQRIAETGKPVFLSTGAAHVDEISDALFWLGTCQVTLLACDLVYPCPDNQANLGRIQSLKRFNRPVGYSDHTLGLQTALAAAAAGATVLEKHATLDAFGDVPDDKMAVNPDRLADYVYLAELGEELRGDLALFPSAAEEPARKGARRSLHAARDIKEGEKFVPGDFICLRPAGDYPPGSVSWLRMRRAARDIPAGKQLERADTM